MSIRTLRTLQAIAQAGSFASAGDKIGLTQAAISTQMKQLEAQLSSKIFEKVGRNLVLTRDGEKVKERADHIIALYDALSEGLGEQGIYNGELLIGAVFSVQVDSLGPALASIRKSYPKLNIKVFRGMSVDLAQRVEAGELDAVLITEPQRTIPKEFSWTTIESEPFYVVSNKNHPEQNDADILSNYPFIKLDPLAWAGTMIENEIKSRKINTDTIMELDSLQAALIMVQEELGVTVMALGKRRVEKLKNEFKLTLFGQPPLHRNIGLYQRNEHDRKPLVHVLLDELLNIK
ncbi:LysR family transcriptional regulator [Vibrio sp. DW001]|uniref:LysR family transcriptional regulator n=1 Tax=Vibrio sp. DW001 TaxID=2912315 RepID=UPI0023B0C1E5|nr:LysR family transcriptional regulator [Vibrio sp. DW001]WED29516.1 LysR family transcriptional regulator [Vibrio sp. DW001]